MIPQPNDTVIICFKNSNIQLEGIVVSWTENESVLKTLSGKSTIVINKTLENVLFYKIIEAKSQYSSLKDKPIKTEDDIKSLADYKIELNDLERAEIREKLTSHSIGEARPISYGSPFIKNGLEDIFKK
jgi:hypothetical protein